MFITSSNKSPLLSLESSDSEDEESPLHILDQTIQQNEDYQSALVSMIQSIESRIHLNNLKLDLYEYLKKQKKSSYKRRFWYDQISFYPYDDDADKIPEPLRILKLIRSQQKKRNISHFLTKIMQEIDENVDELEPSDDEYFNDNAYNNFPKPIKPIKSIVPITLFLSVLPKKDPKEFNWLALAKKVNAENRKSKNIEEEPTMKNLLKIPINLNNNDDLQKETFSLMGPIEPYELFNNNQKLSIMSPIQNFEHNNKNDKNIIKNGKKNSLFTGLQLYKCYMKMHQLFNQQGDWSKEDDEILSKAVMMHGCEDWKQIANYLDGKDTGACFQRWYKYVNPSITKGKWTMIEDIKLALYLEFYGKGKWSIIAKKFVNRTDVQIRERWCNILDPHLKNGNKWRVEEDELLLKEAPLNKFKWSVIASKFEGRTDNQCTRRYKKLTMKNEKLMKMKRIEHNMILNKPKNGISLKEAFEKKLPIFTIIKKEKKEEQEEKIKTEN